MSIVSILHVALCAISRKARLVEWAKSFFPTKSYSEVKAERRDESRRAKDLAVRFYNTIKIFAVNGDLRIHSYCLLLLLIILK